jgi:hypothetical protein
MEYLALPSLIFAAKADDCMAIIRAFYQPKGKTQRSPLPLFFHDFSTKTRETQLLRKVFLTQKARRCKDAKMGQHGTNKTNKETPCFI